MAPFKYGMIVDGENYCPRPELARQFSKLVASGLNVVVQGERRMGKTSFVRETIRAMRGMELVYIDLYCVKSIEEFCRRAVAAVADLDRSAGFLRRTAQLIANLRPVLTIDRDTGAPQLTVDSKSANSVASLEDVMDMISAHSRKRRLCIVFDEFQDVLELADSDVLLARLRAKIQFQNKIPHIFLGSVRNKMTDIFMHPNSPFYRGAAPLPVGEIDADDFYKFLKSRFATGKRKLPRTAFDVIRNIARNTPGDMQELCDAIWDCTDAGQTISEEEVRKGLEVIFSRERDHYEIFIRRLTALQMRVLATLASKGGREVFSVEFLSAASVLNAASVKRAIDRLVSDGLVFYSDREYRFVNPFFREWIKRL